MSVVPTAARERLTHDFFDRSVHEVARDLVGCRLFFDGCGGTIVETESYERDDPACHAHAGLTGRTEVLFGPPGRAYVYLAYGLHSLLNAVAEPDGEAAAVLIRALEPSAGLEAMRRRRGGRPDRELCSGPGKLTANRDHQSGGEAVALLRRRQRARFTPAPRCRGLRKALQTRTFTMWYLRPD